MNQAPRSPTATRRLRSVSEAMINLLSTPNKESYITEDSWHGPCHVHVLDRPFRLYQLSEFSVVGELVQGQGANRMGKTYVALYDENMRRVMMVLFGDSWSGSEKGYLNAYFYPQDSSLFHYLPLQQ